MYVCMHVQKMFRVEKLHDVPTKDMCKLQRRDISIFKGFLIYLQASLDFDSRTFEFRLVARSINFAIFSRTTLFYSRKLKISS